MGQRELLEALRGEAEAKGAAIHGATEAEAERLRAAARAGIEELRRREERSCRLSCAARRREIMARAEREAGLIGVRAEDRLAKRLWQRALAALAGMRDEGYGRLFGRLAAEIGEAGWSTVWVNPADRDLAAPLFPGARIVADPAITGGLRAASGDGRLTVSNTLETRLERAWPDLLPGLVEELAGQRP
ncbi:MAG TPA: V-type ATP synthase subunit E [Desulfuromonadaceae bacterium]